MNFEEFLQPQAEPAAEPIESDEVENSEAEEPAAEDFSDNLDVQKAVVESLAEDKAKLDEKLGLLSKENEELKAHLAELSAEAEELKRQLAEEKGRLGEVGDILAKNSESPLSNQVALLDRSEELEDRFPGETRDHVLEALRAARDAAEKDGRLRCAQVLEGVLLANEPSGNLAQKRAELEKLFAENANVINGQVIKELTRMGISHKNGDDYLLTTEILRRTY